MTSRAGRLWPPLAAAGAVGLATLALRLRDPHVSGSWGLCPTQWATGIDCPACGGLRAVNSLTHGDLVGAASSNLLLVVAVPVVVVAWMVWLAAGWQGRPARRRVPTWSWVVVGALIAVFTVVRNLPGSWLAA